jgi:LDH2 family malate/lactate/ureidoglycolate dehydrogenase
MTVAIEVLASVMTGGATGGNGKGLGFFMMALDIEKFRSFEDYQKDVDAYFHRIKNSRKRPGVKEIYMPGEIEHNFTQQRSREGIPINPVVAQTITDLARKYKRISESTSVEEFFAQYL